MNVDLHIERLVLDGVPLNRRQSVALKDALECELSRLLEHRGLASVAGISVPQLPVADIQLPPGSPPVQWGRQIARSLHAGIAGASVTLDPLQNLNGGSKLPSAPRPSAAQ